MKNKGFSCPKCGQKIQSDRNPFPTVDMIIEINKQIVLIKRKNPPAGWALPGGFIDYGESSESAAIREAMEETTLRIKNLKLFNVYSDPERDARYHTVSIVYIGTAEGNPAAADDAADIGLFSEKQLPEKLAFDHAKILRDYFEFRKKGY